MPIKIINPGEVASIKPESEPYVNIPMEDDQIDAAREAEIIDDVLEEMEEDDDE